MDKQSTSGAGAAAAIRPAEGGDLDAVLALLAECGLPGQGVRECLEEGFVAVSARRVVGVALVESHGVSALLRSVAVAPGWRRQGLARRLCAACRAQAREAGVVSLYLLTESAADCFLALGFRAVSRDGAPPEIRASGEFSALCPETAALMTAHIG